MLMNYKTLVAIMVLAAVPFAFAAPKAYDTVFYKGKTSRLKIVFEFGHLHVEESNVKVTEAATRRTTKFYLSGRDSQAGTGKMRFDPVNGNRTKKEVLLEIDPFGDPPPTVTGTYITAGRTIPFTLKKRKKH